MIGPFILDETENFAVVFKPPKIHCAPLKGNNNLLEWYAAVYPPVMDISGRKKAEGGLLHRLDYETHGLVLFAKNQITFNVLLKQQEEGNFIKEYHAICNESNPSFTLAAGCFIESFFRPFGRGRKEVRPVTAEDIKIKKTAASIAKDRGNYYRTEIIGIEKKNRHCFFTVRLKRGFRHQIRCHLAWKGYPVLNDPLYGNGELNGFLALCAWGLFFTDPANGRQMNYCVDSDGFSKKLSIAADEKPSFFSL